MRLQETIERDVEVDRKMAVHYRGYTFPRYEGKLTRDEELSGLPFYAYWGDQYLPEGALRLHVSALIDRHRIPEAA